MNKKQKLVSRWALGLVLLLASAHAMAQSTVTYVYTDQQGTPLAEADANGNITATFDYAPYGSQALGNAPNGPGYTGHVNDPDTGLVYMQARYYDSATGRFLSVDPVGPAAGNTFNFSRYAYANNNPIVNMDPDGRCSSTDAFPCEEFVSGDNGGGGTPPPAPTQTSQSSAAGGSSTSGTSSTSSTTSTSSQMASALSNGSAGASESTCGPCSVQPATGFIRAHQADAATLADELGVPTNYVLAVAGNESAYGTSNIAVGASNYFGMHAGAPGSIGPWPGNPIVAAFASSEGFMASGQSFVQVASPLLQGLSSPISSTSFFTALHAKWGIGTTNYVQRMVQQAKMAQIRMNVP